MVVALIVLLALGLLVIIVLGLHRFQKREAENNADRQSPLPPLDVNSVTPLSDTHQDSAVKEPVSHSTSSLKVTDLKSEIKSSYPEDTKDEDDNRQGSASWQKLCMELRSAGQYDKALLICRQHFPQWGAFSQAATILRAEIRSTHKLNKDVEPQLRELFKLAVHASFLHDKLDGSPTITTKQLKLLPPSAWENLDMPYSAIGLNKLRLLVQSDRKMMSDLWGEPVRHVSAREFHREAWQRLLQIYAAPAGQGKSY